jgi:hypothetical protein
LVRAAGSTWVMRFALPAIFRSGETCDVPFRLATGSGLALALYS